MTVLFADFTAFCVDMMRMSGLAFWLSFIYQLTTIPAFVRKKTFAIIHGILFGMFSGLITFLYILGQTTCRSPRWFVFAGLALGVICYRRTMKYPVELIVNLLKKLLLRFFRLFWQMLGKPFVSCAGIILVWMIYPTQYLLKILKRLLYNHSKKKHRRRKNGKKETDKRPIEPYSKA